MIKQLSNPTNELLTVLWVVFLNGSDKLALSGRKNIRMAASITKKFDAISTTNDQAERICKDGIIHISFDLDEYAHLEKCFEAFEFRTIMALRIANALDWFLNAKTIEDGSVKS